MNAFFRAIEAKFVDVFEIRHQVVAGAEFEFGFQSARRKSGFHFTARRQGSVNFPKRKETMCWIARENVEEPRRTGTRQSDDNQRLWHRVIQNRRILFPRIVKSKAVGQKLVETWLLGNRL